MPDYNIYTIRDQTGKTHQYTGLPDHSRGTPLMTDTKYNGIAGDLRKPENAGAAKTIGEMTKAQEAARAEKKPFNQKEFLAKDPNGKAATELMADMEKKHGATAQNLADVRSDLAKPEHARLGNQRAVSVNGMPTLPANVGAAAKVRAVPAVAKPHAPAEHTGKLKGVFGAAVGIATTIGAAQTAAAAEGRPVQAKDFAKAAVDNLLPAEAARQGRYAEAAVQLAGNLDATGGMVDGAVRSGLRAMGADVDPGALEAAKKADPTGALKDTQWNQRVHREQEFLMSADHPGQLHALKIKDGKGQDVDIKAALKDPSKRHLVFDEIASREAKAGTPDSKHMFREMSEAAHQYADLEGKRREIGVVNTAKRELPVAPVAMTPA